MRVDDFDFQLPEDRIALRPARPRDAARMLIVGGPDGMLTDAVVSRLPDYLRAGDMVVVNEAKVTPARLTARRPARQSGGAQSDVVVEALLHAPLADDLWSAFVRPARRLRAGDALRFDADLTAIVEAPPQDGQAPLRFNRSGAELARAIEALGAMPLPPYIAARRAADAADREDYQTIYARRDGAVAAPTAGLHFTPRLIAALQGRGVGLEKIYLRVGAGTFLPVKADDTADHKMHHEAFEISHAAADAINAARAAGGRVVAVGTTALRALESAADSKGRVRACGGATDIFITPGYAFRAVDLLLTNFHLPRSTLFMLVAAFSGLDAMKRAYAHAIAQGYRFYSYGDACLLYRGAS